MAARPVEAHTENTVPSRNSASVAIPYPCQHHRNTPQRDDAPLVLVVSTPGSSWQSTSLLNVPTVSSPHDVHRESHGSSQRGEAKRASSLSPGDACLCRWPKTPLKDTDGTAKGLDMSWSLETGHCSQANSPPPPRQCLDAVEVPPQPLEATKELSKEEFIAEVAQFF